MTFLNAHARGKQYQISLMYTMYTNASNNTLFYTHVRSYITWRVHFMGSIGTPKLSNPIGRDQFLLSRSIKVESGIVVVAFPHQISSTATQENTPPNLRNQISSLGPILCPKAMHVYTTLNTIFSVVTNEHDHHVPNSLIG